MTVHSLSDSEGNLVGYDVYMRIDVKRFVKIVEGIIKDDVPLQEKLERLKKYAGEKLI